MTATRRIRKVEDMLRDRGIAFDTIGSYAPTTTILTPNCTIELSGRSITVNEQPTTIDEFIYEVLAVES